MNAYAARPLFIRPHGLTFRSADLETRTNIEYSSQIAGVAPMPGGKIRSGRALVTMMVWSHTWLSRQ